MNVNHLSSHARRWLTGSLSMNNPVPNRILNSQEGEIDVRGKWMSFTANTIYQRKPVSFIWKARLNLMPVAWVIAEDGHDEEKGWGGSKLWGFVPMGGAKGQRFLRCRLCVVWRSYRGSLSLRSL